MEKWCLPPRVHECRALNTVVVIGMVAKIAQALEPVSLPRWVGLAAAPTLSRGAGPGGYRRIEGELAIGRRISLIEITARRSLAAEAGGARAGP